MTRLIIILLLPFVSYAQINSKNFILGKEFSKEIALFNSKQFLFKNVLETSPNVIQFEVIPLAAASSGELTTLLYKCDEKKKEGLILSFYGSYFNESGVSYQGYGFKNLEKNKAEDFLNKIQNAIDSNSKFLKANPDNNNIYFSFEDLDVLIYFSNQLYSIRLFWNNFDSTWERTAFERSKKRFESKIGVH